MSSVTQDDLWADLKTRDANLIRSKYGSVMATLAHGLRGAITASPGKVLYVADYASIEARVLVWLAEDEDALEIFRKHEDPYCAFAPQVYGRTITKADTLERSLCKIAILGLGYGMGAPKFLDTCAKFGITIDDEFAAQVVAAYRAKYWRVKQLWYDQEAAAIAAVQSRTRVPCYNVTWVYRAPFLFCILPSGRRLAYPYPRVKSQMMPWGKQKDVLSYMGVDGYTRRWKRQYTYGGSLVENQCQSVARDILAEAMLRVEAHPNYQIVLSVHDELICEAPKGVGSNSEFETLLTELPNWALGCPIAAEGWSGYRYKK